MFSKRRIVPTLLVVVLAATFIRLGIWQLDRLRERKARVADTMAQLQAPTLVLDEQALHLDLSEMVYRQVTVTGEYDYAGEVVLRNQVWSDANMVRYNGVHLLTPLIISGTGTVVIVDRGWIPAENAGPELRAAYQVNGPITVKGIIRSPQSHSEVGLMQEAPLAPGETRRADWNFVNVEAIGAQIGYPVLGIYVQEEADGQDQTPPYTAHETPDLSEGSHLGFAFQWFALAGIALIGYPILLKHQPVQEEDSPSERAAKGP